MPTVPLPATSDSPPEDRLRSAARTILAAALVAVDPVQAVRANVRLRGDELAIGEQSYDLREVDRIIVVGGGKAGAPMAAALHKLLGGRITAGAVNVKYGHTATGGWSVRFGGAPADQPKAKTAVTGAITLHQAGHPIPDAAGLAGSERIAGLLKGLTARDLVIVLLSGGGSALLPLPMAGITLADYQELTAALLLCGAGITEINVLRKHCSRLQGGQLLRLAAPARVATLILSDVVGSPLDAIASGPTAPDPSTFADALAILRRYGLAETVPPAVRDHLARGAARLVADTPKPGDPVFKHGNNIVIGDNAIAGRAAVAAARGLGFRSELLTTFLQGEAREVGRAMAGLAQGIARGQSDLAPPVCLVLGGETTVTVRGAGKGGRNQEMAVAAGLALYDPPLPEGVSATVIALGTDGTDGPTDAAGGIGTATTASRACALGLDLRAALADNASYPALAALGDLIVTGPTGTNVNDLVLVMVV